jgi:hypothetical protein
MTKLTKNIKLYSKLLLSVGQQGRGLKQKQPLQPDDCGEYIKRLMDEEDENKIQVSERLGLGRQKDTSSIYKKTDTTQVSNFLKLLDISKKSRKMSGWGWEGPPKIAFSVILKLRSFPLDEQDKILQAVKGDKQKSFTQKDVQKIINWRKINPDLSIDECIEKVLNLILPSEIRNIVVCEIHEKLKNFIKSNENYQEKILDILTSNLNGKFYDLDATDILISISMDDTAYKTFHEQQFTKDVSYSDFINSFLEEKIV